MKNLFTICLCLFIGLSTIKAQEVEKTQTFKHEVGLDMTDLMRQFLFSNNSFFPVTQNVTESYTLSYRLMYKDKVNLRLGVGGYFNNGERTLDTINFDIGGTALRYRIGIDKIQPIKGRWEAYYGIDFFQELGKTNSTYTSTNNNYIRKSVDNQTRSGISPLVGIRFRFNERIGLQTSLNAEFYQYSDTNTTTYEVLDSNIAAVLPTNQTSGNKTNGLDINIPINLVLTFIL